MTGFEKKIEEIDGLLEKGNKASITNAEIKAEMLIVEVRGSECLEKDTRIAKVEVILGICQAFLGKFDDALKNLESALRKHISFDALNLCDAMKALTMLDVSKNRINVIQDAGTIIADFREFTNAVRTGLSE